MKSNPKKDVILFGDKISFEPVTSSQREEVFDLIGKNKYLEALISVKKMIKINIDFITENTQEIKKEKNNKKKELTKEKEIEKEENIKEKILINFSKISMDDLYKLSIEKIISTYLYYQEYFSNILLVIHLYLKLNLLDKINRTLLFLKREMDLNKFSDINKMIIKFMVQNESNIESKNSRLSSIKKIKIVSKELYNKCQEIYFSSLKIYVSCAQYAINLRELNLFEKFLLEFVMKISLLLTKDNYIICNTFLLVGNLYMKLGNLKKAHFFYEKIVNKNQHGIPTDKKMSKVIISAHYNLGLIYYVTGKYETAKLRLENALEIKKNIVKNNYDTELIQIYETLAEVDVQYKNYTSAYLYIEEGIKLLNNKIINTQINENIIPSDRQRSNNNNTKSLKNFIEKSDEKDFDNSSDSTHQIIANKKDITNENNFKETSNFSKEEFILKKNFKF